MKRRLKNSLAVTFLILGSTISYAQAQHTGTDYANGIPVNYVRTWDATAPEADPNTLLGRPLKDVKMATQYFDGLGRPLQTVIKQGSLATGGTATDLVSPVEYDVFGREQYKWLPYAAPTENTGVFKKTPFAQQLAFYNDPNGVLKGQGESYYYNQTVFESSPLNRVQESYAPGISWAGSASQTSENNRHSGKMKYWFNTVTDDVKIWNVSNVVNSFGTYSLSSVNFGAGAGIYPAGELYKTVTVDEHNKQVVEFKDKEGKVILKKVQLTAVSDDGTGKNYTGWLNTYYIYDDLGNLRCVIQPEGVKWLLSHSWNFSYPIEGPNALAEQCFRYEYDSRNRMIMKKVPGADPVYMVYDQRDRLVMTQDGNMRNGTVKWMVTLYDDLNRPVQTGLWTDANTRSYHATQAAGSGSNFTPYPFAATVTPGNGWEKLTRTHYDDYIGLPAPLSSSFNNSWATHFQPAGNTYPYYQALTPTTILKGLTTWTETKVLGASSQYLTTVMIYDEKGRPIQVKSINITGGEDVATTQYSWAGQPLITVQKQEKAGTNAQTTVTVTQMSYDDLGRVAKVEKKVSHSQVPVNSVMGGMPDYKTIAINEYDKLGRVKTKKLAPAFNSNAGLETITYDYNIRGWMLGANRDYAKDATPAPTGTNPGPYFGFDLGYDKANNGIIGNSTYAIPQYNGNIEGMVWKSKGDGEKRKYDFAYDAANRLLKADFTQYTNSAFNQDALVNFNMKMGDGVTLLPDGSLDPTTAYDDNGNIKQMQQWGLKINTSDKIDNLKYTYLTGTNKLKSVTDFSNDATTKLGDFRTATTHIQSGTKASLNANSTPAQFDAITDYNYDINGNLNLDNNKGITSITYNHLNLPQTITLLPPPNSNNGSRTITYIYDAAGNKLRKEVYESSGLGANKQIFTTYINGLVYESKLTNQGGVPELDDHPDLLQFIPQEEGRIRFKPATAATTASLQYDYMLKDHLGNVRMVLTEEQEQSIYPAATLEPSLTGVEIGYYTIDATKIVPNSVANDLRHPTTNLPQTYPNNNTWVINNNTSCGTGTLCTTDNSANVYKLNSNSNKTGLGITLKVMAGDKLDVWGKSYYSENNPGSAYNNLVPIIDLLTGFLNSPGAAATTGAHGAVTPSGINTTAGTGWINSMINEQSGQSGQYTSRPRAFINVIFFDEKFKAVDYKISMIGTNKELKDHYQDLQNLTVPKNGFVYIYCSNETPVNVFFDNVQVVHTKGAILEETHYYPFGLTMAGISSKAAGKLENKYKYNVGTELASKEFSDGSGLDWFETTYRSYDPQIGRFHQLDPLADLTNDFSPFAYASNNPILRNDPTGLKDTVFVTPKSNMQEVVVIGKIQKLKGGEYDGQSFQGIKEEHYSKNGWSGSTTKQFISDGQLEKAFQGWIAGLRSLAKAYGYGTALTGGSAIDLKSIKDYKEFFKKLIVEKKITISNPAMLAISTIMGIRSGQFENQAEALAKILSDYHTKNSGDVQGKGMYVITQSSYVGTMGGSGGTASSSYYDVSSKNLIGNTNEHY